MTFHIVYLLISAFWTSGCKQTETDPTFIQHEIPLDIDRAEVERKPIQMWIDAHANFSRFADKANITKYMEQMKAVGINEIYVDVKPGIGYALYDSDILEPLTKWGDETVQRDWDYLAFWLEEADRLDMEIIASLSVLGYGYTKTQEGPVYDSDRWKGKTQMEMRDSVNPNSLTDIRSQSDVDAAMLNPAIPEVQSFVVSIIEEIVTKYPGIKGICLDYCRWYGGNFGFGDDTMDAFKRYSNKQVVNNNDIITNTGGIGPLYKDWIEFRSMTVTNLITNINQKMQSIDPKKELHLWASADWASRYSVGQNWASKNFKPIPSSIYTEGYNKTGFADQIDVFSLGAYADAVWKSENPTSVWSVENFVTTYENFTMGDTKVYGSFASYAYSDPADVSDAVYLSLKNTDGVMVFELSHVINNNQWNAIQEGIERVYTK